MFAILSIRLGQLALLKRETTVLIPADNEPLTGKQMCEFIAEVMLRRDGKVVDPEAIWNLSPTGELWPVLALFQAAKAWAKADLGT